ncbi:MAG: hypothetical protein EXR79_06020 [Myxococcales bacterium]|nr:hypothetical protein [Myxococcales bacterium]
MMAAAILLLAAPAYAGAAADDDWLDLRRKGPAAVAAAADRADAPEPSISRYRPAVAAGHPLHGALLTLARAPVPGGVAIRVRLDGPGRAGEGASVLPGKGGGVWLRTATSKSVRATPAALFTPVEALGVPWALFLAHALTAWFDTEFEGEFDDVAIARARPKYVKGPGLQPMKVGVSKRWHCRVVAQTTDLDGHVRSGLLWLETRREGAACVHGRLRLRPAAGEAAALEWTLIDVVRGKAAGRLRFDGAGL